MAEFIVRFFGRFVFAQNKKQMDVVEALAIDMRHNPDVPAERHSVVLSAPRGPVLRPGSLPPDLVIMANTCNPKHEVIDRLEHQVWSIEGYDVMIEASGGFSWSDKTLLLDLGTLSGLNVLSATVRSADAELSPVTACVHLRAGSGTARMLFREQVVMVPLKDASTADVKKLKAVTPADLVEVTISTKEAILLLHFKRRDKTGPSSSVAIKAEGDAPTVINFSNLCSRSDDAPVDEEFAGMYEVLDKPPRTRDRLVPRRVSESLGGEDDCYKPAYLLHK